MKKILTLAVLAAFAAPVFAGDMYFVGSIGESNLKTSKSDIDSALTGAGVLALNSSLDDTDSGYKLQLGTQINPNFAIEGGYVQMGEAKYSASFTGGNATVTWKAHGWNIDAVGILPINDSFSLFGKAGMVRATVNASATATGAGASITANEKESGWKPTYGIGATYNMAKNTNLRFEYERFSNIGDDSTTGKSNVDMLTVGIVLKF